MKSKKFFHSLWTILKDPVFLLCLLLAILFFFITKGEKNYTVDVTKRVWIDGVAVVRDSDTGEISIENDELNVGMRVRGRGFSVMSMYYFSRIHVPAESFTTIDEDGGVIVDMQRFRSALQRQMKGITVDMVYNHGISIASVERIRKHVPVRHEITAGGEYMQVGDVVLEPSVVEVSGPRDIVDKITYVSTMPRTISSKDKEGRIDLRPVAGVKTDAEDIFYSVRLERFTEYRQQDVPVQIKGHVDGQQYIAVPSNVDVIYNVTHQASRDFSNAPILFYVDLSEEAENNTYTVHHSELPVGVEVRSLIPDRIQVLHSK